MEKSNSRKRTNQSDGRKLKKRVSPLKAEDSIYLDYKDVDLLRRFMSDRAKIRSRKVSGNDTQQQRLVARAVKNAREMGLLAYTSRVTTQRRGGGGRNREDGGRRSENRNSSGNSAKAASETPVKESEKVSSETEASEVSEG